VIAVVIDEPVIAHYGGTVAGPVFRRIGETAATWRLRPRRKPIAHQRAAEALEEAARAGRATPIGAPGARRRGEDRMPRRRQSGGVRWRGSGSAAIGHARA
jgi:hypothetical protein